MFRSIDNFLAVTGRGAREYFCEFRYQRAGDSSAADDGGQRPPKALILLSQVSQQVIAGEKSNADGDEGCYPDQVGQRMLKVKIFFTGESAFTDGVIDKIRCERSQNHKNSHGKNPDDKFTAHIGVFCQSKRQKSNQRNARYTISFKAIRGGANAVAGIVTGAIGDDTGVFGVVFRKMKHDFHQVGTNVGDFGEDTTADTKRGGAE